MDLVIFNDLKMNREKFLNKIMPFKIRELE